MRVTKEDIETLIIGESNGTWEKSEKCFADEVDISSLTNEIFKLLENKAIEEEREQRKKHPSIEKKLKLTIH